MPESRAAKAVMLHGIQGFPCGLKADDPTVRTLACVPFGRNVFDNMESPGVKRWIGDNQLSFDDLASRASLGHASRASSSETRCSDVNCAIGKPYHLLPRGANPSLPRHPT